MSENASRIDFDTEMAWTRRFEADAAGNLRSLALRLQEAMPDQVTVDTTLRGFFSRGATTVVGVTVRLGENAYTLKLERGRLQASVALIVRGVAISNKPVPPEDWFRGLSEEARKSSEQARSLSRSIDGFMST
jgi:hypothetical protein